MRSHPFSFHDSPPLQSLSSSDLYNRKSAPKRVYYKENETSLSAITEQEHNSHLVAQCAAQLEEDKENEP